MRRAFYLFLILLATCVLMAAQNTLTLSAVTTAGAPGSVLTVQVNYAGPVVAGLEWQLTPPTGSAITAAAGPAATAGQKSITCRTTTSVLCILTGINALTMSPGQVATYQVTLPLVLGSYTLSIPSTNLLGADLLANKIAISPGANLTVVVVPSRYDLNGDGKLDALDLALANAQILGISACTTADFNADGVCDVRDAEMLILASLGMIPQ